MYSEILVTTFKLFSSLNPNFFHNLITKNGFVGKLFTSVDKSVKKQIYNLLQCELNMN